MIKGLSSLYYRELRLMSRNLWATFIPLITSLLYLFLFGLGIGGMMGEEISFNGENVDYILFLAPGVIAMGIISIAQNAGWTLWNDRDRGMLEELLSCPVSRSAYIMVKILSTLTFSFVQVFLVLVIGLPILKGQFFVTNIYLILLSTLLGGVCFCSLFIPFMSRIRSSNLLVAIVTLIFLPIMLCSSMFYPLESAPYLFKIVAYLNPMTYTVDILRAGLIGSLNQEILLEILVLFIFTIALFAASVISLRKVRI
ncbi:MAG: ABC-2 type transporter [Candidatus Methanolliviera sp. GoM_oil]|nr:MAG: ABC-2 type transporter [Candidatus Methanolliviera sp. GoM_oil]